MQIHNLDDVIFIPKRWEIRYGILDSFVKDGLTILRIYSLPCQACILHPLAASSFCYQKTHFWFEDPIGWSEWVWKAKRRCNLTFQKNITTTPWLLLKLPTFLFLLLTRWETSIFLIGTYLQFSLCHIDFECSFSLLFIFEFLFWVFILYYSVFAKEKFHKL